MRISNGVKKMTVIYLAVIFFVALDRLLKLSAVVGRESGFNIISNIFRLKFQANYYMAFSLPLAGAWFNVLILLIILFLIYYLARAWHNGQQSAAVGLFAIILGAASNLFDRLKYGYVIDYLDLKYFTVFNLADMMISAGVISLLFVINNRKL